jgi:hypothetical protein
MGLLDKLKQLRQKPDDAGEEGASSTERSGGESSAGESLPGGAAGGEAAAAPNPQKAAELAD